jgi:hypothetical protein
LWLCAPALKTNTQLQLFSSDSGFYDSAYRYSLSSIFYGEGRSNLICACGSQNEIAVEVEELMNQQLLQDSHSLIGSYKRKAQTEQFWLGQQESQQGNGRAGLGCNSRPNRE